jgi:hypothetical protein
MNLSSVRHRSRTTRVLLAAGLLVLPLIAVVSVISGGSTVEGSKPAAITYGPDNWGDMDIDCDLITASSFFYTSILNGFVRQVVTNTDKCAWTLDGAANVQGNNIVLPAEATVNITSKKAGNEGFVLTISTNPTPPGPPPPPPPPPDPVALADALTNVRYLYPDRPSALNGLNFGASGQNFRDHWIDCDRITETATFNIAPPASVTTMRSDLLNFANCTAVSVPNVNPTVAGNARRRTISTNGQVTYTNTSNGKSLTVIFAAVPTATSALSSRAERGVVGQPLTLPSLTAVNFTPNGFSVDPALPDGLSIDAVTGEISGTPTTASKGQYAITASDGTKQGTGILTLEVSATPVYVITYDQAFTIDPFAESVSPGQSLQLPTTNSVKDASVFAGWRTEPAGAGELIGMSGDSYTPTSSLTLYADWNPRVRITFTRRSTADPYPIFPPEFAPWLDTVGQLVLDFVQGSEITLPVPTRANAGFRGWYNTTTCPTSTTQSSLFIAPGGTQVVAPSVSTATWRACWQTSNLTIGFNPRSGTFTGTSSSCSGTNTCNVTWTAEGGPLAASGRPQVVTPPAPIRTRQAFKGWFTSSTGGIRVAGPNEPIGVDFSEPSGSTARSYQAQWTPLIVFDPGEGQEVNDTRCLRESDTPRLCLIEWAGNTIQLPVPSSSAGSISTGWFQGSTRQGGPGEVWTQSPYGGAVLTSQWISLPASPTDLVATPGDGEVTIAFTAGADGGDPITNYEFSVDDGSTWTAFDPAVTASPVTISALTNGTEYVIRLRAVNAVGAGAASAAVTATPVAPTVPPVVAEVVVAPPTTVAPPITTTVPAPVPGLSGVVTRLPAGEREVLACAPVDGNGIDTASTNGSNCVVETVEVVVENEDQDLVVRSQDFELRLAGECASACRISSGPEGRQTLEFEVGGNVRVSGAGFVPGSQANVWLFSDPRFLGSVEVNPDGSFVGSLPIGQIEVGEHTIQVNGVSADGRARSVNLGIMIREPSVPEVVPELPAAGTDTNDKMHAWSVLFLALGALMWLVARRPEEDYAGR